MSESRPIGDWLGTSYSMGGERTDWQLSLWRNGRYVRKTRCARAATRDLAEEGNWDLVEDGRVLELEPRNSEATRWAIGEVTSCEGARTLLVLRFVGLVSRNLPILLYRVHPQPGPPPMPLDAHGFPDSVK